MITMTDNAAVKKYEIKSYEANANNEIKPYFLLHHMEDIAQHSASSLGFGYQDIYPKGYGWFVLKYHIKIERMPRGWENITLKSWPCEHKGIQCRREFEIYDENENKIGIATSLWVLMDLKAMRILAAKKAINFPPLSDKIALDSNYEKLPAVENADNEITLTTTFEDIDVNQHVNNSNYINWVIKSLDYDFLKNHSISEIEINYKHEIKYGKEIICKTSNLNEKNQTLHTLVDKETNEEAANIRITWVSR